MVTENVGVAGDVDNAQLRAGARDLHHLVETSPELRDRRAAWRNRMQRDLAAALKERMRPSEPLVAEMVTGAINAAYGAAADQWTGEGAVRSLEEYTEASG